MCLQVIVERGRNERSLPLLDRTKFLVPDELSLAQFTVIVRWGQVEYQGEHVLGNMCRRLHNCIIHQPIGNNTYNIRACTEHAMPFPAHTRMCPSVTYNGN